MEASMTDQTRFVFQHSQPEQQLAQQDFLLSGNIPKGLPSIQLLYTQMKEGTAKEYQAAAVVHTVGFHSVKAETAVSSTMQKVLQARFLPPPTAIASAIQQRQL